MAGNGIGTIITGFRQRRPGSPLIAWITVNREIHGRFIEPGTICKRKTKRQSGQADIDSRRRACGSWTASAASLDCGYRTLVANNGKEALEVAKNHLDDIHLLLSDVMMPEMAGVELAQ
jgi:hypothetical protein